MGENDHPIRKLLRDLPRMTSSQDFEERLERRLAGAPDRRGLFSSIFEKLSSRAPIPAFAYSLLIMLTAGIVTYYMFFVRNLPETQPEGAPPPAQLKSEPPVVDPSQGQGIVLPDEVESKDAPGAAEKPPQVLRQSQTRKRQVPREEPGTEPHEEMRAAPARKPMMESQEAAAPSEDTGVESVSPAAPALTRPMRKGAAAMYDRNISAIDDSAARADSLRADSLKADSLRADSLKELQGNQHLKPAPQKKRRGGGD